MEDGRRHRRIALATALVQAIFHHWIFAGFYLGAGQSSVEITGKYSVNISPSRRKIRSNVFFLNFIVILSPPASDTDTEALQHFRRHLHHSHQSSSKALYYYYPLARSRSRPTTGVEAVDGHTT